MSGPVWYYPGEPEDKNDPSKGAPSLIKQVQCPSDPPSVADSDNFKGIAFAGGQAFPEAIGQLIGGNFTGLGKNEDSFWGKTGLDFVNGYSGSKRIYGQNYYLPLDGKVCGRGSKDGCTGEQAHLYVRSYPVGVAKANMSFAIVEDLLDINPVTVLMSMFDTTTGIKCRRQVLPVGNSFDLESGAAVSGKTGAFINVRDIIGDATKKDADKTKAIKARLDAHYKACKSACDQKTTGPSSKRDNCYKDCTRVWWEEDKCAVKQKGLSYVTVKYPVYMTTSVVFTIDQKNLLFYLPSGVIVRTIFSDKLTPQKAASLKHLLTVAGMAYPSDDTWGSSSGDSNQQSQPLKDGKEAWTVDNRATYVGAYDAAAQTYTLKVYNGKYQADASKRVGATVSFSVNLGNRKVTRVIGGQTLTVEFATNPDKSQVATFENERTLVPYDIPAVSLSKKEQKDNTADTSVKLRETFRGASSRGDAAGILPSSSRSLAAGRWWTVAAVALGLALLVLLLLRRRYGAR